jgi:glucose/arabinose dehydrogenase
MLGDDGRVVHSERLFHGDFGRLRDVLVGADGSIYLATSNRDGRGERGPSDDMILRLLPR